MCCARVSRKKIPCQVISKMLPESDPSRFSYPQKAAIPSLCTLGKARVAMNSLVKIAGDVSGILAVGSPSVSEGARIVPKS